eukprot:TRINITY_DN5186_c0_g1_i1.p1 TRINITY_DN5186_c0_g1~~TRINITY_DN5186_c0_g1_i1.p1  ORF type:complete len:378 (-),score=88.33 TRINITY_DN5186_c0_g1_i1:15-1148(-)
MVVAQILLSSVLAVLSVFALGFVGFVLVKAKIIEIGVVKSATRFMFVLPVPCLLISTLSKNISISTFSEYWVIAVFAVLNYSIAMGLGMLMAYIIKPDPAFKGAAVFVVASANVFVVPTYIAEYTCGPGGPLSQFASSGAVFSFIIIYARIHGIMMWSLGYKYLTYHKNDTVGDGPAEGIEEDESSALIGSNKKSAFEKIRSVVRKIVDLVNPPLVGSLIGLPIGLVPALKDLFYSPTAPPVFPYIMSVLHTLGSSSISCLLVLVGATFATTSISPISPPQPKKIIFAILFTRLVGIPSVQVGIVFLFSSLNLLPADPILKYVLYLVTPTPTNIDVLVITQLLDLEVKSVNFVVFWGYVLAIFTVTAWNVLFIYAVN